MKTKLILIGGIPGTGKTTISYKIALKLKIDKVINIDLLKIIVKTCNSDLDKYFYTTTHEAYKLDNLSVIDGYLRHSEIVNKLVINVLDNIKDNIVIIEGATINEDFINRLDKNKYDLIYINLLCPYDILQDRYILKNKIRKGRWSDNLTNIKIIDKYLKNTKYNILNVDTDYSVERIVNYVKKNLYVQ